MLVPLVELIWLPAPPGIPIPSELVSHTMLAEQMMNDLPDVAGSLFTNQYKAVKIEGKKVKPNALEGTGSVRSCLMLVKLHHRLGCVVTAES